jgi:multiple sugar transport system substrate-binding protein
MVGGKLYAIPMDGAALSMFYRRDLFKEAGLDPDKPPTTWEEVTEYGKQLTKRDNNGHIIRAGWGWEARSLSSHFYYWGTLLPQKGADFLNKDGTKNGFDNDAGMAAFQYLYDNFNTSHISALGLAPTIGVIDDFGAGRVAMTNSGFWLPPSLEAQYPKVTYKDGIYGIARLPQFADGKRVTRLNPWVWMVSSQSRMQKEAWQLIAYMTKSRESQALWLQKAQYIQPVKGYADTPEMAAIPYGKILVADTRIGVPTPRTPQFNQLATATARIYDEISASGAKPERAVPEFARRVDRLLKV